MPTKINHAGDLVLRDSENATQRGKAIVDDKQPNNEQRATGPGGRDIEDADIVDEVTAPSVRPDNLPPGFQPLSDSEPAFGATNTARYSESDPPALGQQVFGQVTEVQQGTHHQSAGDTTTVFSSQAPFTGNHDFSADAHATSRHSPAGHAAGSILGPGDDAQPMSPQMQRASEHDFGAGPHTARSDERREGACDVDAQPGAGYLDAGYPYPEYHQPGPYPLNRNQPRSGQPGSEQAGVEQPNYIQPNYDLYGYNQTGDPQPANPQAGHPQATNFQAGYPLTNHPQPDYPGSQYPETGYPQPPYPGVRYPQEDIPQGDYFSERNTPPFPSHHQASGGGHYHHGQCEQAPYGHTPHEAPPHAYGEQPYSQQGFPPPGFVPYQQHAADPHQYGFGPSTQPPTTMPPAPSIDELGLSSPSKRPPQSGWRKAVHRLSGGSINPGESDDEVYVKRLVDRINAPIRGDYRIAVLSLKGGVGKTTTTVGLGSTFASLRGDRVIAVDANPDLGTLAQRVPSQTTSTVRDLLEDESIFRYSDVRAYTSQAPSRLEVIASERDPAVSEAFSEDNYRSVVAILQRFYNIILTDCGTGLMHSAMKGVLDLANTLILVTSPAIDGARSASATLDWLEAHGYDDLVRRTVVVVSSARPGASTVDVKQLTQHFLTRCRHVQVIPFDNHLSEGAEVDMEMTSKTARRAFMELAAAVADDFNNPIAQRNPN